MFGSLAVPLVMRGRMEKWIPAALPVLAVVGFCGILLAPGGLLVWIVLAGLCSGGESGSRYLRLWPHVHHTDGFFAAVWQRKG